MSVNTGLRNLISGVKQADDAFKSFYQNSKDYFGNIDKLIGSLGTSLSSIPVIGNIAQPFTDLARNISAVAQTVDGFGSSYRNITTENLNFASSVGQSIDNVLELNKRLVDVEKTNSELSRSGFFINTEDTNESFRKLKESMKDSSSEFLNYSSNINGITVSAEQMTAALQDISGLDQYTYYTQLNKLVSGQGQTFDEAIKTLVSYKDVAKETGLSVSTISNALENSTNSFSKLGLTVNFAKPALEGFSSVMKDVGLGISEASSLTSTLSNSLINVANDYGKAYVMFQQGGLDFGGGGGALGSSIGFRAKMLGASQEEQEQIGTDMIKAMRDTLSNLTGGQGIVDVRQAAESPELQSKYLQQEQLLSSMFGISDQGQKDRTLELLSQIDLATKEGNSDRAFQLSEELKNAEKGREETKSMSEKLGAITAGSLFEHIRQTALLQKQVELTMMKDEDFATKVLGKFGIQKPEGVSTLSDLAAIASDKISEESNKRIEQLRDMITSKDSNTSELLKTLAVRQESSENIRNATRDIADASVRVNQLPNTINVQITNNGNQSGYVVVNPITGQYRTIDNKDPAYGAIEAGMQNPSRTQSP